MFLTTSRRVVVQGFRLGLSSMFLYAIGVLGRRIRYHSMAGLCRQDECYGVDGGKDRIDLGL